MNVHLEPDQASALKEVQDLTDDHVKKTDEIAKKKEQELLTV